MKAEKICMKIIIQQKKVKIYGNEKKKYYFGVK